MKKVLGILLKTVVPLALGLYLFWYFFDGMDKETERIFNSAIRNANYGWILLSLLLSFLSLLSRAYRWKYTLEPLGYQTSFWNRYHALMVGYLMNLTIPRAGEATRSVMLYRSDGVPFSKSFGTIVAERVFDIILLLSITFITAFLSSDDFWHLKAQIESMYPASGTEKEGFPWVQAVFASLVLVIGVVLWRFKTVRQKFIGFFQGIISGALSIFKTKRPFSFIGHTLFIWVMYVTYFSICFFALPMTSDISFNGMLLAFVAGSVGISLTNGGMGVFPIVVGMVITYFLPGEADSVADGTGKALGMIIWASQTVMMIVLGLLSFILLPKNYTKDGEIQPNQS